MDPRVQAALDVMLDFGLSFPDGSGFTEDDAAAVVAAVDTLAPQPPPCSNHSESQHRDGKPPWCNACGWGWGRPATPPFQARLVSVQDRLL
jgi:hypothetical protein